MKRVSRLLAVVGFAALSGCGYNRFQALDEQVKSSWAEVVNQYKRRADLIPNLVKTVQGFAKQEKDVLLGVTDARSRVGALNLTPEALNDPKALEKFQAAQSELGTALQRLLVVSENYPQLKSEPCPLTASSSPVSPRRAAPAAL